MTHPGPAEVNELLRKAVEAVARSKAATEAMREWRDVDVSTISMDEWNRWNATVEAHLDAEQDEAEACIAYVRTLAQPAAAGEAVAWGVGEYGQAVWAGYSIERGKDDHDSPEYFDAFVGDDHLGDYSTLEAAQAVCIEHARNLYAPLYTHPLPASAGDAETDALRYELADLHDSIRTLFIGRPRESFEDACEATLIGVGHLIGLHGISVPGWTPAPPAAFCGKNCTWADHHANCPNGPATKEPTP